MIEALPAISTALSASSTVATRSASMIQAQGVSGSGGSFAETVQALGRETISKLNTAEEVSMKALAGGASPREVAEAVTDAERSLQVAIAIRDKITTAYLEVSRMAI